MLPQVGKDTVAIVGAGVIGCSIAWALAREGRRVLLIDRDAPGRGGASFGNVGHVAAELVEPLPSPRLLFGFWRELFAFGGPLSVPLRRLPAFAPWACRFAAAAFRRPEGTRHLAPLVKPSSAAYRQLLNEIGRPELLRRNGHYQFWVGKDLSRAEALHMGKLGVPTAEVSADVLKAVGAAARKPVAGLFFPESAHVVDPYLVCESLAHAVTQRGASVWRAGVRAMQPRGDAIEIVTNEGPLSVGTAVIAAGVWSTPLLAAFGLHAPLEAARGYHIDMPGHAAFVDAPSVYVHQRMLVTPMLGRVRASGYMEFAGIDAPPDPRKPAQLRHNLKQLGFRPGDTGPSWMGHRSVLPDYLPGIGHVPGAHRLFYAVGHQHIGLTLAPVTGDLIADLVAERTPRHAVSAFDLRRFGRA